MADCQAAKRRFVVALARSSATNHHHEQRKCMIIRWDNIANQPFDIRFYRDCCSIWQQGPGRPWLECHSPTAVEHTRGTSVLPSEVWRKPPTRARKRIST